MPKKPIHTPKYSQKALGSFHQMMFLLFACVFVVSIIGLYTTQKLFPPAPSEVTQSIRENSNSQSYLISVEYPKYKNIIHADIVNAKIEQLMQNLISGFTNQVFLEEEKNVPNFQSSLTITYHTIRLSQAIISTEFLIEDFQAGNALPTNSVLTFNYDLVQQKEISIADVFKPNTDFSAKLSQLTADDLHEQFAKANNNFDDFIKAGTTAQVDNFRKFLLSDKNLIIVFDPAVVAPSTAGVEEVDIPYVQIRPIINSLYAK